MSNVENLKSIVDKINKQTPNTAEFVRFIPCVSFRDISGNRYTLTYNNKFKKYSLIKRVNVGLFSDEELFEFIKTQL